MVGIPACAVAAQVRPLARDDAPGERSGLGRIEEAVAAWMRRRQTAGLVPSSKDEQASGPVQRTQNPAGLD